jgi:uncharacterized protein (DUF1697 family)
VRRTYLALLRGINVGGKNIIPMADLRACVAALGARDVATYIQSGNVIFDGDDRPAAAWTDAIEAALSARFDYHARIVLRDHDAMRAAVHGAPPGFDDDLDSYRCDVMFLRGPTTTTEVVAQVRTRDGVDRVFAGDGVVYFERLAARASQSRLSSVMSLPVYAEMTIRNWRTTTTLLAMLDDRAAALTRRST